MRGKITCSFNHFGKSVPQGLAGGLVSCPSAALLYFWTRQSSLLPVFLVKPACGSGSWCNTIYKQWLHWNSPCSSFWKLHLSTRKICGRLFFLFCSTSLESVAHSQELFTVFCYVKFSELWLQLMWQYHCHRNNDFIVSCLMPSQGKRSHFLWLLLTLERLVKQDPFSGFS